MLLDVYSQKHYLVLDGAQDINILRMIYELGLEDSCKPLYCGTKLDFVLDVSPCLIEINEYSAIYKKFLTDKQFCEKGIYISSNAEFKDVFQHLQSLLFAMLEDNSEIIFRFYDPHVLSCCSDAFSPADIDRLLGIAQLWRWADIDNAGEWRSLQRTRDNRVSDYNSIKKEYYKKFVINDTLYREYCRNKDIIFIKKMKNYFLEKKVPFDIGLLPDVASQAVTQARKYGLTYESTLTLFTLLCIIRGPKFYLKKEAHTILDNKHMHQLEKMELVLDQELN